VPEGLKDQGLVVFHNLLLMGPYKAFASTGNGGWEMAWGQFDHAMADRKSLENCRKSSQASVQCTVVVRRSQ